MSEPKKCGKCGRMIGEYECGLHIKQRLGYGSTFDGALLDTHLCPTCTDKFIQSCKCQVICEDSPEYF